MPRDLFEEAGISPGGNGQPRDLFAEAGIAPQPSQEQIQQQYAMGQANSIGDAFKHTLQGGINASLMPGNLADRLASKIAGAKPAPVQVDFAGKANTPSAKLGEIGGALMAPLPINKLAPAVKLAQKAVTRFPNALNYLAKTADAGLQGSVMGAGFGAADPNADLMQHAGNTGLVGAGLQAALGLPGALITGASNIYKNVLLKAAEQEPMLRRSPEQVNALSRQLGGQQANIGELVDSPASQTFYTDILGNIPYSGVKQQEGQLVNAAAKKQDEILKNLKGNKDSSNIPEALINHIKTVSEGLRGQVRERFSDVFKNAEKANISLEKPEQFLKTAKDILRKQSSGEAKEMDAADLNYIKNLTSRYDGKKVESPILLSSNINMKPSKIITEEFNPASLEEAHFRRSDIGDEARTAKSPTTKKAYTALKQALDSDMRNAIEASDNPQIIKQYENALKLYRDDYLPYKNPALNNVLDNKVDENLLINQLLNSKNKKILEDMPPDLRKLVAFSKIGKGETLEGEIFASPRRTSTLAQKIPASVRKRLFTPSEINNLNSLNALADASQKATLSRNKPPTGYKNTATQTLAAIAGGAAALGGKALSLPVMPAANVAAKTMTSNALRDAYINRAPVNANQLMDEISPEILKSPKAKKILNSLSKPQYRNALYYMLNNQ